MVVVVVVAGRVWTRFIRLHAIHREGRGLIGEASIRSYEAHRKFPRLGYFHIGTEKGPGS